MTNATQTTPIDLQEYLEYTYPKLTNSEIDVITHQLSHQWINASSVTEMNDNIRETATLADIQLYDEDEGYIHDSEGC